MVVTDFDKGLDFSALSSATGADHNNLIDLAVPHSDKSINIWSVDTALNTPDVPDPTSGATFTKWKRYLWIRIPHSSATDLRPIVYAWNDNATSVATYLKWKDTSFDDTDILADIATLQVDVADAANTANSASATASSAAVNAASALTNANAANTTATTAAANATTALTNAATAQTDADTAQVTADSALANAASAQTTADGAATNAARVASSKFFTSSLQTWASHDVAHGLGAAPKFVRWVAVCNATDVGYAANDEIDLCCFEENTGNFPSFTHGSNATNVIVVLSTAASTRILNKSTGAFAAIDTTKWNLKAYAWS
jgi:hypothetical protein